MFEPNLEELTQRFGSRPLTFEVNPPPRDERDDQFPRHCQTLTSLVDRLPLSAVNLPEIQEEEQKGENGKRKSPHKQRISPREYAHEIGSEVDVDFLVNRVIVQESGADQETWFMETCSQYDIHSVVLVGGESSDIDYPGPSVTEGNQLIKDGLNRGRRLYAEGTVEPTDFLVGNICISTRRRDDFDEPERMRRKIQSGCDFFTSQILAEPDSGCNLLRDLARELEEHQVPPPALLWSFTPIQKQVDVDFLRWLGVRIPESIEERILSSSDPLAESRDWIGSIWDRLQETAEQLPVTIPLGLNICPVALRNYDASVELADQLHANHRVPTA